ncbi:MAG TPA: type II toxin-antitoxin system VapC family toxin, partial [Candidatus Ozemobacteraceae bacterium]|nr:type II toxin-antitoxin system VapC family toxin [Candidatus Ozemobacteraceae bacterium]
MIVVDTNILLYLTIPTVHSVSVQLAWKKDPEWASPVLWRSEFKNAILVLIRKGVVSSEYAQKALERAAEVVDVHEYLPDDKLVMDLALRTTCSGYDCEFAALARELETFLLTYDKKVLA